MKSNSLRCSALAILLILCSVFFVFPAHILAAEDTAAAVTEEGLPPAYCMRDDYIIYAQNQDKHGLCWNFASTMAAATTIMKATGEYYDFSELWSAVSYSVCSGKYKPMGGGGSFSYHKSAMQSAGLMLEVDLPYQYSYTVSDENAVDYYNFYEKYSDNDLASTLVSDSETSFSRKDVEEIKQHIYNHGSVYMAFSFRTGFTESGGAYSLEPNQKNTNSSHAVSVIGWDDNYEREFYFDGSTTPTVFKGAWIILNSYTEKSGHDGISLIFYDDNNISSMIGYRYEPDTSKDLYFYDTIESGYAYPTSVAGKYYGDFTAEVRATKQKNIFYNDVNLAYSYIASQNTGVEKIDIFLGDHNVTELFDVRIDNEAKRFYISKENAPYGQYKVLVTYGNGEASDTYLNNFFVTHGLVGEEIEYDHEKSDLPFAPGRDLEFYSFMAPEKTYVIYTNKLKGEISFLPTEQSVYSEKNMSIPTISYEITDGKSCTKTYSIVSNSGYTLTYTFIFEYCEDANMQPVNVYYDLGGGINHEENHSRELASLEKGLTLYAPSRPGYTFAGWYLDYGDGSRKVAEENGVYTVLWDDIHHMGESPSLRALSYYKEHYNNSNTLFLYAHWEELSYYTVNITIMGEGESQIHEDILISSETAVRYLFKPKSGGCLSELRINGERILGEALLGVAKSGLLLQNVDRDISITATFDRGVYLSLKCGENVKNAYIVGTKDGVTRKFYDGDFIPQDYFANRVSNIIRPKQYAATDPLFETRMDMPPKRDPIFPDVIVKPDIDITPVLPDLPIITPVLPDLPIVSPEQPTQPTPTLPFLPLNGTQFSLVVELFEDPDGSTYVLENAGTYTAIGKGIFQKNIVIDYTDIYAEIQTDSAFLQPIEEVKISYSVGSNIAGHYLSADKEAKDGAQNAATFRAGEIVYLFIKLPSDTPSYQYRAPEGFEPIGNQWYRKPIHVSSAAANLGSISASGVRATYTVTWKNHDGSVLYSETYYYGSRPVYNARREKPTRADDSSYSYIFIGWDQEFAPVHRDTTYTAVFETVPRRYTVTVEPTENGTVTPDEEFILNRFEQKTFVFTPDAGYRVKDVLINGVSVGAVSSYTFTNVRADQTLLVEFERITHTVHVICGENGTADRTGALQVIRGENLVLRIIANEKFHIDTIKINGEIVASANPLTIENITQDLTVEITFKPALFHIQTQSAENGSITPSFSVTQGENARVDFHPKFFYKVKNVTIDGVSIGSPDHYVFTNVTGDHTVWAEYEISVAAIILAVALAAAFIGFIALIPIGIQRQKRARQLRRMRSMFLRQKGIRK